MGSLLRGLAASLLVVTPMLAASNARGGTLDSQGLGALLKLYQDVSKIEVKFTETKTLKDMTLPLESKGVLTVERPAKVVWRILKPSSVTAMLENGTLTITSGEGEERKTETFAMDQGGDAAAESLKGLVAWLRLDVKALLEEYEIRSVGKHDFEMTPKRKSAPFWSLTMTVKAGGPLEKLVIREKSGDSIAIRFDRPEITR